MDCRVPGELWVHWQSWSCPMCRGMVGLCSWWGSLEEQCTT